MAFPTSVFWRPKPTLYATIPTLTLLSAFSLSYDTGLLWSLYGFVYTLIALRYPLLDHVEFVIALAGPAVAAAGSAGWVWALSAEYGSGSLRKVVLRLWEVGVMWSEPVMVLLEALATLITAFAVGRRARRRWRHSETALAVEGLAVLAMWVILVVYMLSLVAVADQKAGTAWFVATVAGVGTLVTVIGALNGMATQRSDMVSHVTAGVMFLFVGYNLRCVGVLRGLIGGAGGDARKKGGTAMLGLVKGVVQRLLGDSVVGRQWAWLGSLEYVLSADTWLKLWVRSLVLSFAGRCLSRHYYRHVHEASTIWNELEAEDSSLFVTLSHRLRRLVLPSHRLYQRAYKPITILHHTYFLIKHYSPQTGHMSALDEGMARSLGVTGALLAWGYGLFVWGVGTEEYDADYDEATTSNDEEED